MDFYFEEIWEVLGIEPGADIQAIRAAYSEKIKEHHPEDDPEGFMLLRNAYKTAVKLASKKDVVFMMPTVESEGIPKSFDFSQMIGKASQHDTDQSEGTQYAQTPELDFSNLDIEAEKRNKAEMKISDEVIERLTNLHKSRNRRKRDEWKALLEHPTMERLKHNEYFIWAFLDFIAVSTDIPVNIRENLIEPFLCKCRDSWIGSDMWGEFEVANQKELISKKERIVKKTQRIQSGAIFIAAAAGLLTLIIIIIFSNIMVQFQSNASAAMRRLLGSCYLNRGLVTSICVANLSFLITIFYTQAKFKKIFANTMRRRHKLPNGYGLLMVALTVIMLICINNYTKKNTEYIDDISQLKENRLSIAKAYAPSFIPSDRGKSWLEVIVFGEGKTRFVIPHGLEFDIEETDLTETHSDTETKTDGGTLMNSYIISYTDNTKTVFSIQNVILAEQENYYAAALESDARGDYEQAYKYLKQAPDISGAMCLQGKYLILERYGNGTQ